MADSEKATGAKVSSVLADFDKSVIDGFIEDKVKIAGFTFTLRTPSEDDEVWADSFIKTNSPFSLMSSRRAPRLSVAIKSITPPGSKEPKLIEELFQYPDEFTKETKEHFDSNPTDKRYWLYSQLMKWLAEKPTSVVEKLYSKYEELTKRRDEALKGVLDSPNA